MTTTAKTTAFLALVTGLAFTPVTSAYAAEAPATPAKRHGASRVERIEGSDLKRIILTPKAAQRLAIKTGTITADADGALTAPYAALLYDPKGQTWVYTNPELNVFLRHRVVVAAIQGKAARLKEGPAPGTVVVVVGASELFGTESGVGH